MNERRSGVFRTIDGVENLIILLKDLQSVNIQLCLNICTVVSVSKQ